MKKPFLTSFTFNDAIQSAEDNVSKYFLYRISHDVLCENLKTLRKRKNMSSAKLGEAIDVPDQMIRNIENGLVVNISDDLFKKLYNLVLEDELSKKKYFDLINEKISDLLTKQPENKIYINAKKNLSLNYSIFSMFFPNLEKISQYLKLIRILCGASAIEFAALFNLSKQGYYNYETKSLCFDSDKIIILFGYIENKLGNQLSPINETLLIYLLFFITYADNPQISRPKTVSEYLEKLTLLFSDYTKALEAGVSESLLSILSENIVENSRIVMSLSDETIHEFEKPYFRMLLKKESSVHTRILWVLKGDYDKNKFSPTEPLNRTWEKILLSSSDIIYKKQFELEELSDEMKTEILNSIDFFCYNTDKIDRILLEKKIHDIRPDIILFGGTYTPDVESFFVDKFITPSSKRTEKHFLKNGSYEIGCMSFFPYYKIIHILNPAIWKVSVLDYRKDVQLVLSV